MKKVNLDKEQFGAPFSVPEGYFDQLEDQIISRTAESGSPSFLPSLRWALVPALLVIITSGIFVLKSIEASDRDPELLLSEVSNEEIMDYLVFTELSEDEILSLSDQDILIQDEEDLLNGLEFQEDELDQMLDQLDFETEYM